MEVSSIFWFTIKTCMLKKNVNHNFNIFEYCNSYTNEKHYVKF